MFDAIRFNIRLVTSFRLFIGLMLGLIAFGIYNMINLSDLTGKLYRHPFSVSTSVLRIEGNIIRMHRSMKDVALARSEEEIHAAHARVDGYEEEVKEDFLIIHERFLGSKKLVKEAERAFLNWRAIREEVIALMLKGEKQKAADITKGKGAAHIDHLMDDMRGLKDFAFNKADAFISQAMETKERTLFTSYLFGGLILLIGWSLGRGLSRSMEEVVGVVSSSSAEMATTLNQQERIISQQSASAHETNTTMEELRASSRQTAEQAEDSSILSKKVLELSEEGLDQVEEMLSAMAETKEKVGAIAHQIVRLSEQTSQIGNITGLVTDFAAETKMLAMNAAVEAVRAGEHGKGFSVLSVEIRKLAGESKRSADKISQLVEEIQKATNATVMVTEEGTKKVSASMVMASSTAETFQEVADSIGGATESVQQIALNAQQQAVAVNQVVEAMGALSDGAKEASDGMGQVKVGIASLNDAAQKLKSMV